MKMYCITIYNEHSEKIKKLGFIPVGLGNNITSSEFNDDKKGLNISNKNPFYGEYTFHYWIWKNQIHNFKENEWIGFCQYRKYWSYDKNADISDLSDLKNKVVRNIPSNFDKYDVILGEPIFINKFKLVKLLKEFFKIIKNQFFFLMQKEQLNFI